MSLWDLGFMGLGVGSGSFDKSWTDSEVGEVKSHDVG